MSTHTQHDALPLEHRAWRNAQMASVSLSDVRLRCADNDAYPQFYPNPFYTPSQEPYSSNNPTLMPMLTTSDLNRIRCRPRRGQPPGRKRLQRNWHRRQSRPTWAARPCR